LIEEGPCKIKIMPQDPHQVQKPGIKAEAGIVGCGPVGWAASRILKDFEICPTFRDGMREGDFLDNLVEIVIIEFKS